MTCESLPLIDSKSRVETEKDNIVIVLMTNGESVLSGGAVTHLMLRSQITIRLKEQN